MVKWQKISDRGGMVVKKIEVHLFGVPSILLDGAPVSFPYKKAEGFLYYLCVKKTITREAAICLLWGDEEEAVGRKKLRDAIYQVRLKLGKEVILTNGHTGVSLNPDCGLSVDWDRIRPEEFCLKEPFLNYFYIKNCYEFEEWVEEIRDRQNKESIRSISEKFEQAKKDQDLHSMQEYGNILIKENPYREDPYYELMDMYAKQGDYIMAVRLYYDLEKCLREEMGVEPSRKIRELFQRIFHVKEHIKTESSPAELPFIGRNRELFAFSEFLEKSQRDPVSCIVVSGEEGVGKTEFLESCLKLASSRHIITLKSACCRQGKEFYLNPWSDIIEELRQIRDNSSIGDLFDEEDEARFSVFMNPGSKDDMEGGRFTYSMIERAVTKLLESLTMRYRVLLAFDDIQWMDRMSLQLLNRLAGGSFGDRLLFLCTCGEKEELDVMTALEMLVRKDKVETVALHPFTKEETEDILHRLLPELDADAERRQSVFKMTEGNAFFLKEMINLIRKKGFTLEKSAKTNLAIRTRLSGITVTEREVLEAMSVFPEKIKIEELEYLMQEPDRLALLKRLERLQEEFLIREVLVGWNVYYKFSHRLFQEYVYENQSNGKKQLYHRRMGEYYASLKDTGFRPLSLAAYHFEKCHDQVRAYQYQIYYLKEFYTVINENFPVMRQDIPEPQEEFGVMTGVEKMLELAGLVIGLKEDSPLIRSMKMEMYYIKGRYEIAAGDYEAGEQDIKECRMLAESRGDDQMILACIKQFIFYGIQTGNMELAEQYVEYGFRRPAGEQVEEYATLMRLKGLCCIRKEDYDTAEQLLTKSLSLFRDLDPERFGPGIAACYNYLGDLYRRRNDPKEAMIYYQKAKTAGEKAAVTNGTGQIYSNIGQLLYGCGNMEESLEYLKKAERCLEKNGYLWGLERTEGYLSLLYLEQGNKELAEKHYEKGKQISDKIRNPETEELMRDIAERLSRLPY